MVTLLFHHRSVTPFRPSSGLTIWSLGHRERTGLDNVEFRLGEIEHLPVADASVDAVISNCVLNLSPDKARVWREIARVLKPGGRVAVSDIALLRPLPDAIVADVQALVGCVAGAALASETERMAREAGLTEIALDAKPGYIDALADGQDPLHGKIAANLPAGTKPSDYVTSMEITARKPIFPEPARGAAEAPSFFTPAVRELVAIGAAIAANCEPCLKYHCREARSLGVPIEDMANAVKVAAGVKDSPHRSILKLADRLTGGGMSAAHAPAEACCGSAGDEKGCC